MSADILCLGEPLIEFVRREDGLYQRSIGGDTSNAAVAAAKQGASVGYLTSLGAGRFGDAVIDYWKEEGIDAAYVTRHPTAQTGLNFVEPDPAERYFTYRREGSAASLMRPNDLPEQAIKAARCLHLSGITLAISNDLRDTAFAAIGIAKTAGVPVSLDTNLRLKLWDIETARAITHKAMADAYIAVTSIDDSLHLTGLAEPSDIANFYHELGPEIVLVTMGAKGCLLSVRGKETLISPAPAHPIDSTGAGDSFAGSFLAYWLETQDPVLAANRAAIVAAGTVSGLGAVDPIPRRKEVLRMSS